LPSLWERLGEIDLPTALVAGERDHKFRDIAERMSARIDGAATALIPNSGHAAHLENPPALAALIGPARRA
jgi:pimeloyl-ACP methyl ester carboxylesterase